LPLPPPDPACTCLVTGASSGIGAEIARELARRGHGVTLVARREQRLRELAGELAAEHGVRAEAIACDLADAEARQRLVAAVAELGLEVEVLINNAGFTTIGRFQDLDPERELLEVRTNVEAVVALCADYVPRMVERGRGAVLNVASTAAFQPIPRQVTYSASKAFVLHFTEAMHSDLQGTGVTATALCPGPIRTEFLEAAGRGEAAELGPSFVWVSPAKVARAAVAGLERGRRVVVPGVLNLIGAIAGRHTPRALTLPLMRRLWPL
jgi:short-subunit dehydrogenase